MSFCDTAHKEIPSLKEQLAQGNAIVAAAIKSRLTSNVEALIRDVIFEPVSEADASLTQRLDENNPQGELWIRSFLINARPNSRGWSVDPITIGRNVLSIVGKPLVIERDPLTGKIDHPRWNRNQSADANYKAQSKKAIGIVERVYHDPNTDSYYADSRITDPRAKDYITKRFKRRNIPIPVSCQLIYDPNKEQPNYYKDWQFTHLAIVDKGAYGPDAKVIGSCNGNSETCKQELQGVAASSDIIIDQNNYIIMEPDAQAVAAASASECKANMIRYYNALAQVPANGKARGRLA